MWISVELHCPPASTDCHGSEASESNEVQNCHYLQLQTNRVPGNLCAQDCVATVAACTACSRACHDEQCPHVGLLASPDLSVVSPLPGQLDHSTTRMEVVSHACLLCAAGSPTLSAVGWISAWRLMVAGGRFCRRSAMFHIHARTNMHINDFDWQQHRAWTTWTPQPENK